MFGVKKCLQQYITELIDFLFIYSLTDSFSWGANILTAWKGRKLQHYTTCALSGTLRPQLNPHLTK